MVIEVIEKIIDTLKKNEHFFPLLTSIKIKGLSNVTYVIVFFFLPMDVRNPKTAILAIYLRRMFITHSYYC